MNQKEIIDRTVDFVKQELKGAEGGHDWWHIFRVWTLAGRLAEIENADRFVVGLAALLHDIADPKFHQGDELVGPALARHFLERIQVDSAVIEHVVSIIENISFKGGNVKAGFSSLEFAVVQDADRLDAMGAIGIARAFNYGGFASRELYNENVPPKMDMTKDEYRTAKTHTINHFYEKLLLLKDRMNTNAGRQMAVHRHEFMLQYLDEFFKEWQAST